MALDASSLTTYTNAELLDAFRWALANTCAGEERRAPDGRMYKFPPLKELRETIDWLEGKVSSEEVETTDGGGGVALVIYGERQ